MSARRSHHQHNGTRLFAAAFLLAGAAVAAPAEAQQEEQPEPIPAAVSQVLVDGDVGVGSQGRIAANIAAGTNNQQANSAVVALGGTALAQGSISQRMLSSGARHATVSAAIEGGAFAASSGLIALNIVAGSDNQQANLAVIAIGIEGQAATDALLSQARASQQPSGDLAEPHSPEASTAISAAAFEGSAGLVQVNLIGGERNSSANTFALTVAAGVNP